MKIEIIYFSRTGNIKKIAEIIANTLGLRAHSVEEKNVDEADILFLGGSLYGFEIDPKLKNFINMLSSNGIKKVAVFTSSAISKSGYKKIRRLLEKNNISVLDDYFYCKGKFKFLNKNKPNGEDFYNAGEFAKRIVRKNQN